MQGHGRPGCAETFAKAQETFNRAMVLGDTGVERVEIAYEMTT